MLIAGFIFITTSCKKDEPMSVVPTLELISATPTTVHEFTDSIKFVIKYTDADGDLGENNSSIHNLFVKDSRISTEYGFRVEQLAPTNSTIAIEGTLNVMLPPTGITNGSSSQTATFSIYMYDRAGNKSNTVTSPSLTIVP